MKIVMIRHEPKRSALRKFLEQIQYTIIDITDEIEAVVQKIIDMGILIVKSYDDLPAYSSSCSGRM